MTSIFSLSFFSVFFSLKPNPKATAKTGKGSSVVQLLSKYILLCCEHLHRTWLHDLMQCLIHYTKVKDTITSTHKLIYILCHFQPEIYCGNWNYVYVLQKLGYSWFNLTRWKKFFFTILSRSSFLSSPPLQCSMWACTVEVSLGLTSRMTSSIPTTSKLSSRDGKVNKHSAMFCV